MNDHKWALKSAADVGFAFQDELRRIVEHKVPELAHLFPFQGSGFHIQLELDTGFYFFRIEDKGAQMPLVGSFKDSPQLKDEFKANWDSHSYSYASLKSILGENWFSFKKFSYVGTLKDGNANWGALVGALIAWVNDLVLPRVEELNERSVRFALKVSPSYDPIFVTSGLVVLECDATIRQGTGFHLRNQNFVTCDHVLGTSTKAFFPGEPNKKYNIILTARNSILDLALFRLDSDKISPAYEKGSADKLSKMDHMLVSGFPNYQIGDSGIVVPGIVTGFRMKSGIRRILTNAPIVKGTSGGPAFDRESKVIGVAVTGSDNFNDAAETEEHGIVPIEALYLLK